MSNLRDRIDLLARRLGLRARDRAELEAFAADLVVELSSRGGQTEVDLPGMRSTSATAQPDDDSGDWQEPGSDPDETQPWAGRLMVPASAPSASGEVEPDSDGAAHINGDPRLGRYIDLGLIAVGGMSEVRRAEDPVLGRTVALKLLPRHPGEHPGHAARFVEEARITSRLQHPGVTPVHELGTLADGRLYFTMPEIRGRTLSAVIREAHHRAGDPRAWSLRRLIGAFHAVCEAVAYAHSRGVIHGDLKPANVMIGDFGEVRVLDWGLAQVMRLADPDAPQQLRVDLAGTPAYMPPEQATGEPVPLSPTRDVYSLGAMLFQILTGKRPYDAADAKGVLQAVIDGKRAPMEGVLGVPDELRALCDRAMARRPEDRFRDAGALAEEVAAWLDGARKREQALALVERSDRLPAQARACRAEATALRAEAQALLANVPPWAPVSEKQAGWTRLDEAEQRVQEARLLELRYVQELQGALEVVPELVEAHDRLARHFQAAHADALMRRDGPAAVTAEALLRTHDRGMFTDWLAGDGLLTLISSPPGAVVRLHRYEVRGRRLVVGDARELGETPLRNVPLPAGSYLCVLEAPGHHALRYPVLIERTERWDGVAPGDHSPTPVGLLPLGALGDDEVVVPAGWFRSGGDDEAPNSLPGRDLWVDAFAMRRHPITNAEYIEFLNALVRSDRTIEALAHAPRERAGSYGQEGALIIGYDPDRDDPFYLGLDADGDPWLPDVPVCMIPWGAAAAYAAWWAAQTGLPWRLPSELEWEKAARGADGRFYPWGDVLDPTWCAMRESRPGRPRPARISEFPDDESPYGVRGLGGNMRDWCVDAWRRDGPPVSRGRATVATAPEDGGELSWRVVRGGAWGVPDRFCRAAFRYQAAVGYRNDGLGFRLVRSL